MLLTRALSPACQHISRRFCTAATSRNYRQGPTASEHELWVSYMDPATQRRQLVGLAQQVLALVPPCDSSPSLVIPAAGRVRHGFFFLRFQNPDDRAATMEALDGTPFATACGTIAGQLQLDAGTRPLDLRAQLNVAREEPDPVEQWLRRRFGVHGELSHINLPRLANNWDQGLAFIRFEDPDCADAALEALDGTPSPIQGCNMFIDYHVIRPLKEMAPNPMDVGWAKAAPDGGRALPEGES